MIVIYANGEKTPLINYSDYHIRHTADGFDEMHFSVDTSDPQYPLLVEEMQVEANGNRWIIKKIYDDDIDCELDLDELRATGTRNFDSGSVSLQTLLSNVLPTGWTVTGASQSTIRRTIRMDFATPLDVISEAMNTYGVCMTFDVLTKAITVIVPDAVPVSGEYITDELNLRKLSYQGETSEFCTRLYAYGQDGLSIADAVIGGSRYGLPYVDNNEYSSKVIVGYWEDARYTVPEELYAAAVARLAEIARPVQSYSCDAIDLAKESEEYSFLAFKVHRKITLIDRKRSLRVVHQIVEYDEYPEETKRSTVTLSSVAPTVKSFIASQVETVERTAQNTASSEITRATELLTGGLGGYIVFHYDENKKPYEMLIMDAQDEASATHVWRYNQNGWGFSANGVEGPYTLAATIDGGIIADFIKTGTLDCQDLTVTNLTASDVSLDGTFQSSATVSGHDWDVIVEDGKIDIMRDGVKAIELSRYDNDPTIGLISLYNAEGKQTIRLYSDGDVTISDGSSTITRIFNYTDGDGHKVGYQSYQVNGVERLYIDGIGRIYACDASRNIVWDLDAKAGRCWINGSNGSLTLNPNSYYPIRFKDSNGNNGLQVIYYNGACNVSVYDAGVERNFIGDGRFSTYDPTGTEVDRICDDGSFFGSDVTFKGNMTTFPTGISSPALNGNLARTGDYIESNPGNVTANNQTWTTVASITLDPGKWLVWYTARFNDSTRNSGRRMSIMTTSDTSTTSLAVMLEDNAAPVTDQSTYCKAIDVLEKRTASTYYLRVWHNAGAAVDITARLHAIRIC